MEAAGCALAAASITIQLADIIRKLYGFWESVEDAPNEVRTIVQDLKLLERVLNDIQHEEQLHGLDPLTDNILRNCTSKANHLLALVNQFASGDESKNWRSRKWVAVKVTFQSGRLDKFRRSLEEMKTTLILIQQSSTK